MPFPTPRTAQITVLDTVRPLAVGAPYLDRFTVLAPIYWTGSMVIAGLFKLYDFEAHGWDDRTTGVDNLGARDGARLWRVTKQ